MASSGFKGIHVQFNKGVIFFIPDEKKWVPFQSCNPKK
jgi:hypothetical protein